MSTLYLFVVLIAIVLLQWFLSKRESPWPGLVIPAISLLFSLLYPFNMMVLQSGVTVWFVVQLLLTWLIANIPTVILLAIYFGWRPKNRRKKQMDRLNIQDLE